MKADSRFEGHIVQGHVDGVGGASGLAFRSASCQTRTRHHAPPTLTIKYPEKLKHLIVEKGSIAIDGVSLTVCELDDEKFSVALIPHTLEVTTLGQLKSGDKVNLEADILGKYARSNVL